jgi:hypothetical protein
MTASAGVRAGVAGGLALGMAAGLASGHPTGGRSAGGSRSPGADARAAKGSGTVQRKAVLMGSRAATGARSRQPPGRAIASAFRARASGNATSVVVFVDGRDRGVALHAALYTSRAGRPGALLTTGSRRRVRAHGWLRIPVRATHVRAGRRYWVSLLATGGSFGYRRRARGFSGFVFGPINITPVNCTPDPSACGYPDPSNTGVPSKVSLKPSRGLTVTKAGAVISGLDVSGSIEVRADDVTIANTRVTIAASSGHGIWIAPGVKGVLIRDSTIRGAGHDSAHALQYAVQNSGSSSNRGARLQMTSCTDCWAGPGTIRDSYAITNGVVPGSHYEPIYYGGGSGRLLVDHDTLVNPQGQTADVYGGNDYGDETGLTITDNLLDGGGWMIYGGAIGGAGAGTRDVTITGNRFARCLTSAVYDPSSGGSYCRGGPDEHGYWPRGGYFGVAAYVNRAVTTWSNNYWDDNTRPVPH